LAVVNREEEIGESEHLVHSSDEWRKGRRIVELDVLAEGLKRCQKCGMPLQLMHTIGIITYGLGSLLKVKYYNLIRS
jgi:hypothetical protein